MGGRGSKGKQGRRQNGIIFGQTRRNKSEKTGELEKKVKVKGVKKEEAKQKR